MSEASKDPSKQLVKQTGDKDLSVLNPEEAPSRPYGELLEHAFSELNQAYSAGNIQEYHEVGKRFAIKLSHYWKQKLQKYMLALGDKRPEGDYFPEIDIDNETMDAVYRKDALHGYFEFIFVCSRGLEGDVVTFERHHADETYTILGKVIDFSRAKLTIKSSIGIHPKRHLNPPLAFEIEMVNGEIASFKRTESKQYLNEVGNPREICKSQSIGYST